MPAGETVTIGWRSGETAVEQAVATLHRHLLVTGTTGFGKSGLCLSLMLALLSRRTCTRFTVVDPKGELASEVRAHFLPALALPGLDAGEIVSIAPFSTYGVRLNPLTPIAGLPREAHAQLVCDLLAGLVDGVGVRMATILQWALRAAMELPSPSLLTVRRLLLDPDFREAVSSRIADPEVRHYLTDVLDREPRASVESVRSRIEAVTLLPAMRGMLCADGSLSGSDLLESGMTIVDLSGSPMGSERIAQFVGSWIFTLLAAAAMSRRVTAQTPPAVILCDEWHRVAGGLGSAMEFERLLSQVRFKRVGLWLANQGMHQATALGGGLRDCLDTNIALSFHFRPSADDVRTCEALLPLAGRRRDPNRPDALVSLADQRRDYLAGLAKLPPRSCLMVDRVAGQAEVMRTLALPYTEAHRRSAKLSQSERDAWLRGRFGVPMAELVAAANRSAAGGPGPVTPGNPSVETVATAHGLRSASRSRVGRLRLLVPE